MFETTNKASLEQCIIAYIRVLERSSCLIHRPLLFVVCSGDDVVQADVYCALPTCAHQFLFAAMGFQCVGAVGCRLLWFMSSVIRVLVCDWTGSWVQGPLGINQ